MGLPLFRGAAKKRDQILALDMGGRTTKAVHLKRRGEQYVLAGYAVVDAPLYERSLSKEMLAEHLKSIGQMLDVKVRSLALAVGVGDAVVRHADLPLMPIGDMRQVLKINTKNYLQQDLPGYVFDCYIVPPRGTQKVEKPKLGITKQRVLVAGARQQYVEDVQAAVKSAGMVAEHMLPGLLGPVNAFELAMPEEFKQSVVALVDVGFKNSSICLVQEGEVMLNRVVAIGGDKLTNGLAEALGISYAEAEGIKVGMPNEVQANLEALLLPLGRELRASIDFFEHQYDAAVGQVLLSGASVRSDFIVQMLQAQLVTECKVWNPLSFLELNLPPQQAAEVEHNAPQLGVAIGAGVSAL